MKRVLFFGLLLLAACSQAPAPATSPELLAQRLGTRADDAATSVAIDTKLGAVYVLGATEGSLGGANQGHTDVFLQRYDRGGKVVWKRQLGTGGYDSAGGVATDGKGFVYAGYTATLSKFGADGTPVWNRTLQAKTLYGNEAVNVTALATDRDGNIYAAGNVYETMFLFKYTGAGSLQWTKSVEGGGIFFYPTSVGTDPSGNVYITVNEVDDSYIANTILKYSPSGQQVFGKTVDVGPKDLELNALQVQGNALYLAGTQHYNWAGDLDKTFEEDAFIAKYTLGGAKQWHKVFGTKNYDSANSVSVDANGNLYVTGRTHGALGGANQGGSDAFLSKFSNSGRVRWTKQIGSKGYDTGNVVVAYSSSELYLAGSAGGALKGSTYRGGQDGFLRRTDGNGNRVWTDQ